MVLEPDTMGLLYTDDLLCCYFPFTAPLQAHGHICYFLRAKRANTFTLPDLLSSRCHITNFFIFFSSLLKHYHPGNFPCSPFNRNSNCSLPTYPISVPPLILILGCSVQLTYHIYLTCYQSRCTRMKAR